MAYSLRLSALVQARAAAYADEIGISLNALVAVALTDYLNARTGGQQSLAEVAEAAPGEAQEQGYREAMARMDDYESNGGHGTKLSRAERRRLARESAKAQRN